MMSADTAPGSPISSESSTPESVELLDPPSEESYASAREDDRSPPPPQSDHDEATAEKKQTPIGKSNSLGLLPCILAGLAVKRSPFRGDSWVDLVLTLDGRDKVTKFIQYAARLLAWYYAGTPSQHKRFASLKQSITSSRKAFRLGRSFIELHRLKKLPAAKNPFVGFPVSMDKLIHAIRYLGLAGFWGMDNTSFLAASGFCDNYRLDADTRTSRRKAVQKQAGIWANQSYFAASVAGFWINLKALQNFRRKHCHVADDTSPEEQTKLQSKHFGLCVALLKSVCDILVFSNNTGIDLWKKHTGSKMNELVHCLCGLTSASVILYKNYPQA